MFVLTKPRFALLAPGLNTQRLPFPFSKAARSQLVLLEIFFFLSYSLENSSSVLTHPRYFFLLFSLPHFIFISHSSLTLCCVHFPSFFNFPPCFFYCLKFSLNPPIYPPKLILVHQFGLASFKPLFHRKSTQQTPIVVKVTLKLSSFYFIFFSYHTVFR